MFSLVFLGVSLGWGKMVILGMVFFGCLVCMWFFCCCVVICMLWYGVGVCFGFVVVGIELF